MILWRLTEDDRWLQLPEGACITDEKFKSIHYLSKPLFEPIQEFEIKDFIEYENEVYCMEKGIEKVLFYTQSELQKFLEK